MKELSSDFCQSDPGLLEEFLFGKDLKHAANKNKPAGMAQPQTSPFLFQGIESGKRGVPVLRGRVGVQHDLAEAHFPAQQI